MADLDDFFAKKDKKKKGTKKFSKANTDVIAQNLEETARKEQAQQDKDINMGEETGESVAQQVAETVREFPLQWTVSEPGSSAHSIYMIFKYHTKYLFDNKYEQYFKGCRR